MSAKVFVLRAHYKISFPHTLLESPFGFCFGDKLYIHAAFLLVFFPFQFEIMKIRMRFAYFL